MFPNVVGIFNGYTLTELGSFATIWLSHECLGPLQPGNVVKITDVDSGAALGPNARGEIVVRPPIHMKEYLNRPEETKAFLDEDGFCHTGDLGHYDEEGLLYFDGRIKELIKPQGNHVHPQEIEDIIQKIPGVIEVRT